MADNGLFIGAGDHPALLLPAFSNRHGLITGATGTGKTITLQVIAEAFSLIGTPVFAADVKGDLAGLARAGEPKPFLDRRLDTLGLPKDDYRDFPVVFWDLFGTQGHPVRVAASEIGPLMFARLLDLNETQTGVLNIAYHVADEEGLLLLDLKDLRSMLVYLADERKRISAEYGHISTASIGAIQRRLLVLAEEGADRFLGEPAIELHDLMRTAPDGRGMINILAADELMRRPRLYATFLVWLLSELFETLPEIGDPDQPRLVLFFDEAHLLFDDAPPALVEKIEQVVRLIRSKGVGVFFVTQNPLDLPDTVLGQLGNRVQHALRAFTRRDQRAVRAAAETFRPNPAFDTAEVITQLGVGEALVSFLDPDGAPSVVERALIRPPRSRMGPLTDDERRRLLAQSPLAGRYDDTRDRESAYEMLKEQAERKVPQTAEPPKRRRGKGFVERIYDTALREASRQIGRRIVRGILGSILR